MSYISINDLSYKYPIGKEKSLKQVNLTIEQGKLYALIGSNGSGKTTLCNVLRGYIPHFHKGDLEGELLIEGKDIRDWEMGEIAQKVGFVFQNPFTQISGVKTTVFEEIAYGLENLGVDPEVIMEKVNDIIELLNINELRDKNPNQLSGGQKQRVAFASIIVMEPEVLIMDEPTSQLDPEGTEEIFKIIKLMKDKGKTIILVEHKIELIAEYADYIVLMQDGEIKMQGDTKEILSDDKIIEFGGSLPQYASLGLKMRENNIQMDRIPVTEAEALSYITDRLGEVKS